jgi:hypothetical protein
VIQITQLLTGIQKIKSFISYQKMKYYSLYEATSEIGKNFPQAQNLELMQGKTVNDPDFFWKMEGDKQPDFKPYIGTLIVKKGSLLTDFISTSMLDIGFVCNEKVRSIILQHSYGNTNFYDLNLKHDGTQYNTYKLMHCVNNYAESVDCENSEFKRLKIEDNKKVGDRYLVSSFEEAVAVKKDLSKNLYGDWCYLEPFTVKFKDDFKPMHDIFKIWGLTYKTYVSEKLRDSFEKNNITGVQYDFDGEYIDFV